MTSSSSLPNHPSQVTPQRRRRRGVLLSAQGWHRLQVAEQQWQGPGLGDRPLTLDQLSELTGISPNTLTKVRRRQRPVDVGTLETYFRGMNLTLETTDYTSQEEGESFAAPWPTPVAFSTGNLRVDSPLYVARSPLERLCLEEVRQPGALITLQAPPHYGKTSFLNQIAHLSHGFSIATVLLSLRAADGGVLGNTDSFLRWFCAIVAQKLGLDPNLDRHWDPRLGASYACGQYWQTWLLPQINSPILLILDDLDWIFPHTSLSRDFFGLVRAWHEAAHRHPQAPWQEVRMLVAHPPSAMASPVQLWPLPVGLTITLPPFTLDQVTSLIQSHGIPQGDTLPQDLYGLLGGHPALTQQALHSLQVEGLRGDRPTLANLKQYFLQGDGPFAQHLRLQAAHLNHLELANAMAQVITTPDGARIDSQIACTLEAMGLVRWVGHQVVPSCDLYRVGLAALLGESSPRG